MSNDSEQGTERRGFLMKSAVLLTALGVAGSRDAAAQGNGKAEGEALQAVLDEAKKTVNIKAAIESKGNALPATARATLEKLTPTDIEQIKSLDSKLGALRGQLAADNNGGNGM
jgi:hypothetical protein